MARLNIWLASDAHEMLKFLKASSREPNLDSACAWAIRLAYWLVKRRPDLLREGDLREFLGCVEVKVRVIEGEQSPQAG